MSATAPLDLQTFISEDLLKQPEDLIYRRAGVDQACFVRSDLHPLLVPGENADARYEYRREHPVKVVSTHRSKSVKLPVYAIEVPGLTVMMRGNFYNWKISVHADEIVPDVFLGLFDRHAVIPSIYCEGFKDEWVFGPYAEDPSKFTIETSYEYDTWTFVWLLGQTTRDMVKNRL